MRNFIINLIFTILAYIITGVMCVASAKVSPWFIVATLVCLFVAVRWTQLTRYHYRTMKELE